MTKWRDDMAKDIRGDKISLKDFVAYQDNSVVSKEIIRKDAGTVTLFAFDEAQGLSEHTVPFDAFVYIVDGKAAITIDGKEHTVAAGETIIMPANKPHFLRAKERFKMLLVMMRK
jgi:quercetin dioxygenase-like cupin family protein